jgi:hypothetical protein
MGETTIYGWDESTSSWIPIQVDTDGYILISTA